MSHTAQVPDVAARSFGTDADNHPVISMTFDGTDWEHCPSNKPVTTPELRKLRKAGVTHVELTARRTRLGSGRDRGIVSADFSVAELLNERERLQDS